MKYVNTILIVDDDPGARDILEALLSHEGYNLVFASSGQEALEKAEELIPSLILLDVMMPAMDGFEVCQRLRAMPRLAEVPVVLITALDDRESRLQGIETGADDFLSKPFDRELLRARVRTILRLNRYRRLHMQRIRFEWVIQQAQDGYVIINENDEILYANAQACLFLGLPAQQSELSLMESSKVYQGEFLGFVRKQYQLHPQEAWDLWPEQPEENPPLLRYLVRPESASADAFWLQVDLLELPSDPDMEKIIRLCDVTVQMNSERKRWGFHTMICHKLRTPLVGILGSLEFLTQHLSQLAPPEIAEFTEMAFKSTKRLYHEIEDILQYLTIPSIGTSGKGSTFSQVSSMASQISQDLKIESMTLSVQEDLHEHCLALSQQGAELLLWEIMENSVKFHPSQSPLITIAMHRTGTEQARILIQDDGQTLSPKQLSQMWVPYYQGERYSTGEIKGMGLGLAIVSVLVWEVGGTCRAYNRADQPGLVIELHLPLVECEEEWRSELRNAN